MKKVLILCTGNSCRSQMAQGLLQSFDSSLEVYSAGTRPAAEVHPLAIHVMAELDLDISEHQPKMVDEYLNQSFDYVVTVCDHARETCPVFLGKVKHHLHLGFADPAEVEGTLSQKLTAFRSIRDEIKADFRAFYEERLQAQEGAQ